MKKAVFYILVMILIVFGFFTTYILGQYKTINDIEKYDIEFTDLQESKKQNILIKEENDKVTMIFSNLNGRLLRKYTYIFDENQQIKEAFSEIPVINKLMANRFIRNNSDKKFEVTKNKNGFYILKQDIKDDSKLTKKELLENWHKKAEDPLSDYINIKFDESK